jgi:hypothetical protein
MLLDFETQMRVGEQYDLLDAHCFEGTTGYFIVRGIESIITPEWESQITKVESIGGTTTTTLLVSNAQWKAYLGTTDPALTILSGNRMAIMGDYLQFLDSSTDAIYRVHKTTGAISVLASKAAIAAVTGNPDVRLIDADDFSPCGDMAFYDEKTDNVLSVDPSGNISVLISTADLGTAYGCPVPPPSNYNFIAGGMTFDRKGNLYWALTDTGSTCGGGCIYRRAVDGTITRILTEPDIWAVTTANPPAVAFNDIFAAPDGNVYFYDRRDTVDSILYFDPADPVNTLAVFITEAQIQAGPAGPGEVNVGALNAFGSKLTWHHIDRWYDLYAKTMAAPRKVAADADEDGDVDLADFSHFQSCFNGPNRPPTAAGCCDMDFDKDSDVDLADFGVFQGCFNGPNRSPACN